MKRTWPVLVLAILLSLFGVYVSYMLMAKHLIKTTGAAWFDSFCDGGEDSQVSCDDVLSSEYGLFPPVPADVDPKEKYDPRTVVGEIKMVPRPVALYGMLYFMVLAGWYLVIGRPSRSRRWLQLFVLLYNFAGVCGSLCFAYIMFTRIDAWCPWCLVTHIVNALLLVCGILLWPRRPTVVPASGVALHRQDACATAQTTEVTAPIESVADASVVPSTRRVESPYPSFHLVVVAAAAIVAALAAEWYFHEYVAQFQKTAALEKGMQAVMNHAGTLYSMYEQNEKFADLNIRPDDPVKNDGSPRLSLVVFSDFQCPHCRRFAKYVDDFLEPLLEGYLKVTFKHFPSNKACNPVVKNDLHPYACEASKAAEAARILGGNDAFWKAHDLLFDSYNKLKDFDYRALAGQLELDPDQFIETMQSEQVAKRILEDIAEGVRVKLDATPAAYLSGRRVPRIVLNAPLFWQIVKQRLDQALLVAEAKAKAAEAAASQPAAGQEVDPAEGDAPHQHDAGGTAATPGNPGP